mmetsp:Transcript_83923/g.260984  ORF Transcript_83923/g.260984 Transcript_83923/m.260984 type:complete len:635 (+) Transcript_83923:1117-3021(+)
MSRMASMIGGNVLRGNDLKLKPSAVQSPGGKLARKSANLMALLRLQRDKTSRLFKLDQLRRSSMKRSPPAEGEAWEPRPGEQPSPSRTRTSMFDGSGELVHHGKRRSQHEALLAAFDRHDPDDTGLLDERGMRAALSDVGLRPAKKERALTLRLVAEAASEAQNSDGNSFGELESLAQRVREAVQESQRPDVEEWFARGRDKKGCYDVTQLRPCLEALGIGTGYTEAEWRQAEQLFDGFAEAAASVARASLARSRRRGSFPDGSVDPQFELFESLVHQAQELLTALRRERERSLAAKYDLSEEDFDEFRPDLLELHELFTKFDTEEHGVLRPTEVINLLETSGCMEASSRPRPETLVLMVARCREQKKALAAERANAPSEPGSLLEAVPEASRVAWLPEEEPPSPEPEWENELDPTEADEAKVNFVEFLGLVRIVRQAACSMQRAQLQGIFRRYEAEGAGVIAIKEVSRLCLDLGMQPRTREEQMEISAIFDEADESGEGVFAYPQFELLVQRVQERLQRLLRLEEERFAMEIGLPLARCRELRYIFQYHAVTECQLLFVSELREVMTLLQRRYSSEELLELFVTFGREDVGGIDAKGFLTMMHAIEVAKSHGQLKQGRATAAPPVFVPPPAPE